MNGRSNKSGHSEKTKDLRLTIHFATSIFFPSLSLLILLIQLTLILVAHKKPTRKHLQFELLDALMLNPIYCRRQRSVFPIGCNAQKKSDKKKRERNVCYICLNELDVRLALFFCCSVFFFAFRCNLRERERELSDITSISVCNAW